MNLVTRRRIGGWTVLVYLLASFGLAFAAAGSARAGLPPSPLTVLVLAAVRGLSLAVAAWGLASITSPIDPGRSRSAMWLGIAAGALVMADGAANALSIEGLSEWTWLPAGLAFVAWMGLTGVILASAGDEHRRIGLLGQFAAGGSLVAAIVSAAVQVAPDAAQFVVGLPIGLLSAFALVYLVRLFALAALNRTPGPGRI